MTVSEKTSPLSVPAELVVVIHSLAGGGAERTAALLSSHWAESGVRVTLLTLDRVEADVYPCHAAVQRIGLDLLRDARSQWDALRNNLRRVQPSAPRDPGVGGQDGRQLDRKNEHHHALGLVGVAGRCHHWRANRSSAARDWPRLELAAEARLPAVPRPGGPNRVVAGVGAAARAWPARVRRRQCGHCGRWCRARPRRAPRQCLPYRGAGATRPAQGL